MPCIGFHCPGKPWLWKDISGCEACEDRCLSIETLRMIWQVEFIDGADHYHNDPKAISVTETMGCLRRAYYDRNEDYAEAPPALLARVDGTNVHSAYERANNDGMSEVELSLDLGGGYSLRGTADRITDDYVADYKTMSGVRKTYDEKNAVQLTIYDEMAKGRFVTCDACDGEGGSGAHPLELCSKCGGDGQFYIDEPGRKLLVIQRSHGKEKIHEVHRVEGALSRATVRAKALIDVLEVSHLIGKFAADIPPEGRDMKVGFRGNVACDYCPHRDTCDAAEDAAAVND
jgi:hypothetical protein